MPHHLTSRVAVLALIVLLPQAVAADALPATRPATAPSTRPHVPPLVVGAGPPRSFVVKGVSWWSPVGGFAFRVATDGERQVCAVYDAADGTPLLLSDGRQTLVYDLARDRIVRIPDTRAYVYVDWNAADDKPLYFKFGMVQGTDATKLDEANSRFRVDRWLDASAARLRLDDQGENPRVVRLVAERDDGNAEALVMVPTNPSVFSFGSVNRRDGYVVLELTASAVGRRVPPEDMAFPDATRLDEEVPLAELERAELTALFTGGQAWGAKGMLVIGATSGNTIDLVAPGATWDDLRRRDAALGERYRAALAKQKVTFKPYKPRPTTGRAASTTQAVGTGEADVRK